MHKSKKSSKVLSMKEQVSGAQKALNVWAIILILWSIYRANFGVSLPIWMDEFIIKPLFFVLPVVWYITKKEKKNFFKRVELHTKTLPGDISMGLVFGVFFLLVGYFGVYLKTKVFPYISFNQLFSISTLTLFAIAIATSISEEILSRGFVLQHLYEESKNLIHAVLISSVLFFFLHIPILFSTEHITGTILLQVMAGDLALSMVVSFLYLKRKSLLLPIIIHVFYILSLTLFI